MNKTATVSPKYIHDPATVDYDGAFDALNKAALACYQVFYFAKLTDPYGYPWKVELNHSGTNFSGFKLICLVSGYSNTRPVFGRNPLELLPKVQMVHEAIIAQRPRVDDRACCPLATFRGCVCVVSFNCPVHGDGQCIGSHD